MNKLISKVRLGLAEMTGEIKDPLHKYNWHYYTNTILRSYIGIPFDDPLYLLNEGGQATTLTVDAVSAVDKEVSEEKMAADVLDLPADTFHQPFYD